MLESVKRPRTAGQRVFRYLWFAFGGFVGLNLIWLLAAACLRLNVLPMPQDVYAAMPEAAANGIFRHVGASVWRVCLGLAAALVPALLLGVPMGYSRRVSHIFSPMVYFAYPIPKLALLPVVMLLLGMGQASKIVIIALIIFFPMLLAVRDAVRMVPEEDYALMTSLHASFVDELRHVILPACLPAVLSSLRISIGISFSALFLTETYGTDKGLGFYITDCWMRLDYVQMYFGIMVLSFAGVFFFALVDISERVFCRWQRGGTR